ncbi:MAG: winged helix-turn-helix transcriptional regulator [Thermoplasmata archaeon]
MLFLVKEIEQWGTLISGEEKLGERLGENEEKILESISIDPHITIKELSEELKISTTAVENNIKKLKDKDFLKRVGPPKGGHWEIITE